MNATYGLPKPPIATMVMVQKQEMVSPQFGTPLFREYDCDGLLLDLFGTFDGKEFDVLEVAITGTRFSVLKLVPAKMFETMNLWCERQQEKEDAAAAETADEDQREFVRGIQL